MSSRNLVSTPVRSAVWSGLVLVSTLALAACDDGENSDDGPLQMTDEGVGGRLDMARMDMADPDMALPDPDMALAAPDMALPDPDMALPAPDMALPDPDMALADPDMALCPDSDDDGVCDSEDICPQVANPAQVDTDGDALGDACDDDDDNDGIDDIVEAECLSDPLDPDSVPQDGDIDGLCDGLDNCPANANPEQVDTDMDGVGDLCDICPDAPDIEQLDSDLDGLGDACDTCPDVQNIELGPVDFGDLSTLTLNGEAAMEGDALRLVPRGGGGSVFITAPVPFVATTSFSTAFRFRMFGGGVNGADGMVFSVHRDRRGAAALGGAGSNMGYGGIRRSIGVAFDTYDNGGRGGNQNDIRILRDGNERAEQQLGSVVLAAPRLNGDPVNGWIDYTAADMQLSVYVSSDAIKPAEPAIQLVVDIHDILQGDQAWFGFTAGTGGFPQTHDLEAWKMYQGVGGQTDTDGDGVGDVCEAPED